MKPTETSDASTEDRMPRSLALSVLTVFFIGNVAIAASHISFPNRVDTTAMIFLECSIAPILLLLFRNFQIGFGDWFIRGSVEHLVKKTDEAITTLRAFNVDTAPIASFAVAETSADLVQHSFAVRSHEAFPIIARADDDKIFVRLRDEIERALRRIAGANGIAYHGRSGAALADELYHMGVLQQAEAKALREVINAGNAQAHGEWIPASLAEYARTEGPGILSGLDRLSRVSHREIVQRISQRATENGKRVTPHAPIPAGDRTLVPDIVIDDKMIIDIPSVEGMSDLSFLENRVYRYRSATQLRMLIVLPLRPLHDQRTRIAELLEVDSEVAIAWNDGDDFDGTTRAREFAPWLCPAVDF